MGEEKVEEESRYLPVTWQVLQLYCGRVEAVEVEVEFDCSRCLHVVLHKIFKSNSVAHYMALSPQKILHEYLRKIVQMPDQIFN